MAKIVASVIMVGTVMLIEGVKRACKKQLEGNDEDV